MTLLLRNYQLTDDIGFRFSSRSWEEYPLTAEKYSSWLASTPGECINIFCDYETFGEHHWPESGIFEFLRYLPGEILKWENLSFAAPRRNAREKIEPVETSAWRGQYPGQIWIGTLVAGLAMPCSGPAFSTKRDWRPQ